jgi:hypothetical protein
MKRAIWSAPPPVPAGTMNCTGFAGSHAVAENGTAAATAPAISAHAAVRNVDG